ncbi:ATP-binding protein [Candidatus Bathyarchaeota archaeon RBG_16_48_13]|nr:MAG: ATP-binding protein [Candidatus Bathyarchaeota archaeon RBG_16_48_13]
MLEKVGFSWSGGKDCALAFNEIIRTSKYDVIGLMTNVTEEYDRVSTHGVRRSLLEVQAESLGVPLDVVLISKDISDEEYESKMRAVLSKYNAAGASSMVFGDIFLENVRKYREDILSKMGMRGIFPNWKKNTKELAKRFMDQGFRAIVVSVDSKVLDKGFVGREFDRQFLDDLPPTVDPCGENGEFHSFAYDGPIFKKRIRYDVGEIVLRENKFYYCDLVPLNPEA